MLGEWKLLVRGAGEIALPGKNRRPRRKPAWKLLALPEIPRRLALVSKPSLNDDVPMINRLKPQCGPLNTDLISEREWTSTSGVVRHFVWRGYMLSDWCYYIHKLSEKWLSVVGRIVYNVSSDCCPYIFIVILLLLLRPEDEEATILLTLRNYSPIERSSHPRRLES